MEQKEPVRMSMRTNLAAKSVENAGVAARLEVD